MPGEAISRQPYLILPSELPGPRPLTIVFAGIQDGLQMPVFEFFNTFNADRRCHILFLRDGHHSWYFNWLAAQSSSMANNVAAVLDIISSAKLEVSRICTMGVSMGGFAALLYGHLLGATHALAFSGQTAIDRVTRLRLSDSRWKSYIEELHREVSREDQDAYFDLGTALPGTNTKLRLVIGTGVPRDARHAEHLVQAIADTADLEVITVVAPHNTPAALKKEGRLFAVIEAALEL